MDTMNQAISSSLASFRNTLHCALEAKGITFESDESEFVVVAAEEPRWDVLVMGESPAFSVAWGDGWTRGRSGAPEGGWTIQSIAALAGRIADDFVAARGIPDGLVWKLAEQVVEAVRKRYAGLERLASKEMVCALASHEVMGRLQGGVLFGAYNARATAQDALRVATAAWEILGEP